MKITKEEINNLINILKLRFHDNIERHKDINWDDVEKRILNNENAIFSLNEMEKTGGEPDLVMIDNNQYVFYDCAKESPIGRRSLCYDEKALNSRKTFKPIDSAVNLALKMGIKILNQEEYMFLQNLGEFDLKTSSWIETPEEIRKLDGALFGDRRYNQAFIYHNGAESYYSSRGFRGYLKI
ncbi:MAG: DUF4256 domain-containing protein [Bacilli bacterium]|nr:DUF4256 domain-containing protein [Bacilli bacterium]